MRGKVALVTGAGAGIGRAVAVRLAQEGAAVVVADVNEGAGQESVRQIEAGAGRGAFVLAEVAAETEVRGMISFAEQYFGGLDVLVNNAGGAPEPHFPEAEPEHWGRTLDVNLRGVMRHRRECQSVDTFSPRILTWQGLIRAAKRRTGVYFDTIDVCLQSRS